MKTLGTILAAVALLVACAGSAQALNLMSELFSYGNGNLTPNGGWAVHSGTITGTGTGIDVQVVSSAAVGDMTKAPDVNRSFAAQDSFGTVYACYQVTIPQPTVTPVVGNYFAHFKDGTTSNFWARLFVLPVAGDATKFTFGVSAYSVNNIAQIGVWGTPLTFGTTYWIVTSWDGTAKVATMWVNPTSPSSPSVSSSTSSVIIPRLSISSFGLRQSSSGSPVSGSVNWTYKVDNLGVGTTFYDACAYTGITPVQNSTWGQIRKVYR
ncbi:MAG: hypothetical protein HZB25_13205 [Candidatus Eisenbacteria bacterium]|nr:hypothetical protein [Candidatus Eisenbacteria bacterium]